MELYDSPYELYNSFIYLCFMNFNFIPYMNRSCIILIWYGSYSETCDSEKCVGAHVIHGV